MQPFQIKSDACSAIQLHFMQLITHKNAMNQGNPAIAQRFTLFMVKNLND
jgi:hypothetical protein